MKHISLSTLILVLLLSLFPQLAKSQSIAGKIQAFESKEMLAYANIDIYKGSNLIASVLADKDGNFGVKLDTGVYRLEIDFAGYGKIVQEIEVTDDEKADFSLKPDGKKKYVAKDISTDRTARTGGRVEFEDADEAVMGMPARHRPTRTMSTAMKKAPMMGKLGIRPGEGRPIQVGPGLLTAGEINDFSRWDLWTDLLQDELSKFINEWLFSPQTRYTVQVTDKKGLPLADLRIELISAANKVSFTARTDNTGKAELWSGLMPADAADKGKYKLAVYQGGKKHLINKAKSFKKGINSISLDANCNQSEKVDIAFVVDATGSMSDELNFLKAELNDVMFKSKQISTKLNFSFANIFYRDHGDAYLTRTQDFTRVLSESASFINDQFAGGGGDFEEAVEIGLDSAINGLSWSKYARTRIVFLVLDAPPHNTQEIQVKLRTLSLDAASKGIRIVPLVASGINKSAEYLLRSMALATNGTYAFLTDHSGIGNMHLKPSTDTFKVETLNELLVRIIKSYSYMPNCEQQLPDLGLQYPDSNVVFKPSIDSANLDSTTTKPVKPVEISWKYYPNPTRGIVNIKASVAIKELYITDLSGKVLQIIKDINPEISVKADLNGYASGIYLIRYPVGDKWISGKVVLIRD